MKTLPAPCFPKRAKAKLSVVDGENRKGEKRRQVELEFPSAIRGTGSARAFDYEIEFVSAGGDTLVRRVLSSAYNLPPENEPKSEKCVFHIDEVKTDGRFLIYPRNSYGRRGSHIELQTRELKLEV